ncbi:MAG: hypothetical protein AAFR61_28710 [Bacteroidota bacterium]
MKKPLLLQLFWPGLLLAQQGIPVPVMATCDNLVSNFLSQYNIPSATFALAKDGKLVYMRAFGHADIAQTESTQPYHILHNP